MIDGVLVHTLSQIPDERGKVMHMLRADDPHFEQFGEIYFSVVNPGWVKGWHLHERMTLNYACVSGEIKLVLYDDREDSPTRGDIDEVVLGDANYVLVRVPPLVWNGFTGTSAAPAIVANCATIPHDPDEIVRIDPHSERVPYSWEEGPR